MAWECKTTTSANDNWHRWNGDRYQTYADVVKFLSIAPQFLPLKPLETNLWITADGSNYIRQCNVPSIPLRDREMSPVWSLDEIELARKLVSGE